MAESFTSVLRFPKLSPDVYLQICDTTRRFAESTVRPRATKLDSDEAFPADIYEMMAQLGLFGITVPEEFGGAGLDTLSKPPRSTTSIQRHGSPMCLAGSLTTRLPGSRN